MSVSHYQGGLPAGVEDMEELRRQGRIKPSDRGSASIPQLESTALPTIAEAAADASLTLGVPPVCLVKTGYPATTPKSVLTHWHSGLGTDSSATNTPCADFTASGPSHSYDWLGWLHVQ